MSRPETNQNQNDYRDVIGTRQERDFKVDRAAIDDDARTVELAFSSEIPVDRWFGREILDHKKKSARLERLNDAAPFLVGHDVSDQVGVIEKAWIDAADRRGRARVRLGNSARADEIWRDIKDGIRQHVSFAYTVHKMVLEEESEDSPSVYRVTDWEGLEISSVPIPADHTVGIGRAAEVKSEPITEVRENMADDIQKETPAAPTVDVKAVEREARDAARKAERERVSEIMATVKAKREKYPFIEDLGRQFIENGKSVAEFNSVVVARMDGEENRPIQPAPNADIGMEPKEVKRWSYFKLLRALADPSDRGAQEAAGLELETNRAIQKRDNKAAHGAFIPNEILNRKVVVTERDITQYRTAMVGNDTYGGYLVASGPQGQSFIELLHNNMTVVKAGAVVLPGLVGDFEVSKLTAGVTYYMVGEDVDVTASTPTYGTVKMAPHTIGGHTKLTRKALLQTSPAVEQITMSEQAIALALGMDYYAMFGSGVSGQPLGVAYTTGVGATGYYGTNGGALDYGSLCDCEGDVVIGNAAAPRMAFITNGRVRREMRQTPEHTTGQMARWVYTSTGDPLVGDMLGYPTYITEQVPHTLVYNSSGAVCSGVLFGDWSQLWIGEWGTVDVNVDTATYSSSGSIKVVSLQDFDVAVRHPESFSVILDITT